MNEDISRKRCRTCLKPDTKLNPLTTNARMLNVKKSYLELLKYVTNMEVFTHDKDHEQQGVCGTCSQQIHASYTFIQQVQECNKYFMTDDEFVASTSYISKRSPGNKIEIKSEKEPVLKQETNDIYEEYSLHQPKLEIFTGDSSGVTHHSLVVFNDTDATQSALEEKEASILDRQIKIEDEGITDQYEFIITEAPHCANEDNTNTSADESYTMSSSSESNNTFDNKPMVRNEIMPCNDALYPVKCEECQKVFDNSLLLKRHKRITHIKDDFQIKCPECPSIFNRRHKMYAHVRDFHKAKAMREQQIEPRKSENIPEVHEFYNSTNLEIAHRRLAGEKRFKCEFCNRAFFRTYDLQIHRRSHTGEAPFKCTVCDKAFILSYKLKVHMRNHTNEKPYKCTECEKAFKQSKDLNTHKRTHTGERPYKCNVCDRRFTQSSSLKRHQIKCQHYKSPTDAAVT